MFTPGLRRVIEVVCRISRDHPIDNLVAYLNIGARDDAGISDEPFLARQLSQPSLTRVANAIQGDALRISNSAIGNPTQPVAANPRTMEF